MNEPYLIEGAVPQSLANLIRESKGEPETTKYLPAQFYSELRTIINSGRYLIKRASGAIASFNDAVAAPLVGLRVALPWRSEGWQAVEVTRCGKNLLKSVSYQNGWVDGYMYGNSGAIDSSASATANGEKTSPFTAVPPNAQCTFHFALTASPSSYYWIWTLFFDKAKTSVSTRKTVTNTTMSSVLTTAATQYFRVSFRTFNAVDYVQLELGSTATGYEPYNGDTYTITLPVGFYGGYLDVVTGQLVATHDENGNLLTNQKLYFLPPVNINALAGVNNVWSDAGDVTVSYRVEQ